MLSVMSVLGTSVKLLSEKVSAHVESDSVVAVEEMATHHVGTPR